MKRLLVCLIRSLLAKKIMLAEYFRRTSLHWPEPSLGKEDIYVSAVQVSTIYLIDFKRLEKIALKHVKNPR